MQRTKPSFRGTGAASEPGMTRSNFKPRLYPCRVGLARTPPCVLRDGAIRTPLQEDVFPYALTDFVMPRSAPTGARLEARTTPMPVRGRLCGTEPRRYVALKAETSRDWNGVRSN